MIIVSSQILEDIKQAHNQRYIRERHIDHFGGEHYFFYAGALDVDSIKTMNSRIPGVESMLVEQEIAEVISRIENGESYKLEFAIQKQLKLAMIKKETEQEVEISELTEKKNNISDAIQEVR